MTTTTSEDELARLRRAVASAGCDVAVLTDIHNVKYASGYRCVMDRWRLVEPLSAIVVPADPALPSTLLIPEALLPALALMQDDKTPMRCDEVRVFELVNFCEMARALDPYLQPSELASATMGIIAEKLRGSSEDNVFLTLRTTIEALPARPARIGVDDLRAAKVLAPLLGEGVELVDIFDETLLARSVKTTAELARFEASGPVADAAMAATLATLVPGVRWNEVEAATISSLVANGAIPVDDAGLLFGGAFRDAFIPELFRSRSRLALEAGQIVILEVLGSLDDLWMDINRTTTVGEPPAEFADLHAKMVEVYRDLEEQLRAGAWTGELPARAKAHMDRLGIPTPDKTAVFLHGVGYMPFEMPQPYPAYGTPPPRGFELQENMTVSMDCLYFGSKIGPCHMENVYVIGERSSRSLYRTPLDLPDLRAMTGIG